MAESNYEVREFYGESVVEFKKLCSCMFRSKNPALENEEEYKKELVEKDARRKKDFFRIGAFYDGKLYGALESHALNVFFDGNLCKMSGIGGVIADYNAPYRGAIKEIYKRSFEIMREKKQFISHLNPFEESYYRQFGYDVSSQYALWKVPAEKLGIYKDGVVKYYDGTEKMQEDIKKVFYDFATHRNLMPDKDWEQFFKNCKPYVSNGNPYVHYNSEGVADAYMNYTVKQNDDRPQDLVVNSLWFSDFVGLRGILSYFEIQKAYCDFIEIYLPVDTDISAFVNSTGGWGKRNTERKVANKYTTRIVDAEEILKLAAYRGEGKVCIKIDNDKYAPWNNDTFTVEFGKETKVVRGGTPDIEMTINSFSSAILGRYSAENIMMFPDVKINSNMENLKKVFYNKKLWFVGSF